MRRLSNIIHLLRCGTTSPRETASLLNSSVSVMRAAQSSPREAANFLASLASAMRGARFSPEETASFLDSLPSAIRGTQYSRDTMFSADCSDGCGLSETPNPLWSYFNAHKQGPGIFKWLHYFDIYHRHFNKFVGREVHVLEIGIYSGGSLPMWKEYFGTGCRVYGVDIEEACKAYKDVGIEVFIGDQADRSFWTRIKQAVPTIDILIDDGGHLPEQQLVTLEEMLPHIAPGGVYLCEDMHGAFNPFAAYVQGLASSLNSGFPGEMPGTSDQACIPSNFQAAISSIHLYPFVAVIEKRERNLDRLLSAKRGTQWLW